MRPGRPKQHTHSYSTNVQYDWMTDTFTRITSCKKGDKVKHRNVIKGIRVVASGIVYYG